MAKDPSQQLLASLQRHHAERCGRPSNLKPAPTALSPDKVEALIGWLDARREVR